MTLYQRRPTTCIALQVGFDWDRNADLIAWCRGRTRKVGEVRCLELTAICGTTMAVPGDWVVEELPQKFSVWPNEEFRAVFLLA